MPIMALKPILPDTDSWRHRKAGASETIISSANRRAKFTELHGEDEASLDTLLSELSVADFVLVEGYKSVDFPKIEIWRSDLDSPFPLRNPSGNSHDSKRYCVARLPSAET